MLVVLIKGCIKRWEERDCLEMIECRGELEKEMCWRGWLAVFFVGDGEGEREKERGRSFGEVNRVFEVDEQQITNAWFLHFEIFTILRLFAAIYERSLMLNKWIVGMEREGGYLKMFKFHWVYWECTILRNMFIWLLQC